MIREDDAPPAELRVRPLRASTPPARLEALDRILKSAARALVSPGEHLASAEERALDADGDRDRLVLYAARGGRTLGLVDAQLHAPAPGDVTIAQLAVRTDDRRSGLGRRLVAEVLRRARRRLGPGEGSLVHAAILPKNQGARAFWERLGLEVTERGPTIILSAPLDALERALARAGAGPSIPPDEA